MNIEELRFLKETYNKDDNIFVVLDDNREISKEIELDKDCSFDKTEERIEGFLKRFEDIVCTANIKNYEYDSAKLYLFFKPLLTKGKYLKIKKDVSEFKNKNTYGAIMYRNDLYRKEFSSKYVYLSFGNGVIYLEKGNQAAQILPCENTGAIVDYEKFMKAINELGYEIVNEGEEPYTMEDVYHYIEDENTAVCEVVFNLTKAAPSLKKVDKGD